MFFEETIEYNEYDFDESKGFTIWSGKDRDYKVSEMTNEHVRNTQKLVKRLSEREVFSYDSKLWIIWYNVLQQELDYRAKNDINIIKKTKSKNKTGKAGRKLVKYVKDNIDIIKSKGTYVNMICTCGNNYTTRKADLLRGWGLSCSKKCAFKRRKGFEGRHGVLTD